MAASTFTKEQKLALMNENLDEVLDPQIVDEVLDSGRALKVYWGTATTGRPHCGYFVPALKIAQLLAAGCEVTILLADIHAFLDNLKAPIEIVEERAKYYKWTITHMLKAVGVATDQLKFTLGSSYQKTPEYIMDVFKLSSLVSEHDAKRAGAEVVKQTSNAPLSGLLYPILQILDEEHLKVDVQFGGRDQRKLFVAAKDWLPKLGYKQRAHFISPMVPGLQGGKMSSSDPDSKIDLLDAPDVVRKKIRKAQAAPRITEGNGLLAFVEYVLLPASALRGKREFTVERHEQEPLVYTDIKEMNEDYANETLTPQSLKPAIAEALIKLMAPIQAAFQESKEWQEITEKAYPPPEDKKKVKKVKDKGNRYPGRPKVAGEVAENGAKQEETREQVEQEPKGTTPAEQAA